MAYSYNRLWKLMIDKKINKTTLRREAGITSNAMAKLGKDQPVNVEVLAKICRVLNCTVDDIKIQKAIADIYSVYITRKRINEQLKTQIRDICPILIKGAMGES